MIFAGYSDCPGHIVAIDKIENAYLPNKVMFNTINMMEFTEKTLWIPFFNWVY